jgi:hypothetical protein
MSYISNSTTNFSFLASTMAAAAFVELDECRRRDVVRIKVSTIDLDTNAEVNLDSDATVIRGHYAQETFTISVSKWLFLTLTRCSGGKVDVVWVLIQQQGQKRTKYCISVELQVEEKTTTGVWAASWFEVFSRQMANISRATPPWIEPLPSSLFAFPLPSIAK